MVEPAGDSPPQIGGRSISVPLGLHSEIDRSQLFHVEHRRSKGCPGEIGSGAEDSRKGGHPVSPTGFGPPLIHIHVQQRGEVEEVSGGDGSRG